MQIYVGKFSEYHRSDPFGLRRLVHRTALGPILHQAAQLGHAIVQAAVGFQQPTVVQGQQVVEGDVNVLISIKKHGILLAKS